MSAEFTAIREAHCHAFVGQSHGHRARRGAVGRRVPRHRLRRRKRK